MSASFAFVFPGQGSQTVGMLDAWGDHPEVRRTLEEASTALGEDIGVLIKSGPKEQLDLTTNTQPVMLTAGIACYRAWLAETGLKPVAAAGHSLGEYTALVAAGALSLSDALPLVRFRAQAMQEAVPVGVGAMAAILGLEAQAVREGCAAAAAAVGEPVEAVNFNDPKQTVIAGTKAGVDKACEVLKAAGAKRALDVFTYRVAKYVGAYAAAMDGRLDAVVFTGGIGENAAMVREMVLDRLALFGFKVDKEANNAAVLGGEGRITTADSRCAMVIPTNEELVIARDALGLVG